MAVIGLCGPINSGKNTVGTILNMDFGYKVCAVADPIKDLCSSLFNWDRDLLEGATDESRFWREQKDLYWSGALNMDITPRKMMQLIGTEAFRDGVHKDIWVKILWSKIQDCQKVAITDIRFHNEHNLIKKNNGKIIKVLRDSCEHSYHKSEQDFHQWDVDGVINNNGSLDDLRKEVSRVYGEIRI